MRLLIDTHVPLWWLTASPDLPARARDLIRDPENTVFASAVNVWEIRLKESLAKLRMPRDFREHWHHRDPFDRLLVAQAKAEEMFLLTADAVVAKYGEFVLPVK
jgi:PIN domain nuclease of toxin-antitoxin system